MITIKDNKVAVLVPTDLGRAQRFYENTHGEDGRPILSTRSPETYLT